ncbi:uncharacterized protein LOC124163710 [Ischnura elegans]|uniref:uncharacterized protein LOC124163710 n=1 Tax=Ischnura elegans TaxID=197161 RepID=UPI001ED8A897|nr:uncharacterized protein LOC124163710 [Ischnura elegans]
MERLLKRVETNFSGSVLGNSLEERLDYEYIAHLEHRNEGFGRETAKYKAKGDLIKAKGRREETNHTDTRIEVVSCQLSPPKNPGTSYRSFVPGKRKADSWDEENGYKNGNLNAKRFHGEGDDVFPVNVVNERFYFGNYLVLPSERKGIKRKNEIDGDCLPFHGNDIVIDAHHFLPNRVHDFDNSEMLPKKKKLCINTQMGCNDTFGRGEGDLSKPMYIPVERPDAHNNLFTLAEDETKEIDSAMDCDSPHLDTEGDAMNGPRNGMDRENPYHHIDGDVKNEKHFPSKQPSAFQHPYEPAEQMEFCTNGMDAINASFQDEYDFGYLCQREPTEEWEEREGAMPSDRFAADPAAPTYLRSAIYQRHSSENTKSMDYGNACEDGERRHHSHSIVVHPWWNETSTNAEQDNWEECW